MEKVRKKKKYVCRCKPPTQLTIHDCRSKTCSASSPPVPLVVMEGLPRLLLSSLEPVESPPPTLLWGLARSCISIDLQRRRMGRSSKRGREGVGENETAVISEWGPERQTHARTAGNPPPLRVALLGAPPNTFSDRPRPRTHSQTRVSRCNLQDLLWQQVFAGTGHYLSARCLVNS